MEVILLEKVKKLGDLGDTVKVKPGYGRNFLLPQGKALPATEANRKVFEARKAELIKRASDSLNAAKLRAEKLAGKVITVKALAAEEGKLYGSVGPSDVVRAAEAQGLDIKKSEIDILSGVIRQTGSYDIAVRLHTEVETSLTVVVEELKG
ncbi:MAG: 50S ribosomal protein L9 [Nevskiaceae bacterium]|nr:MAG: 50S ribosomal protein L9 [Nevskiaceae bacterium]